MPNSMSMTPPPLAQYKSRSEYIPQYGDFIIWSGWFSTWYGFVTNIDKQTSMLSVIFSGLPYLLFTMPSEDQKAETRLIKLSELRHASNGKFAISQQINSQQQIWYI